MSSLSSLIGAWFVLFMRIVLVLLFLMLRPAIAAVVASEWTLSCACLWLWESRAMSSAKSRSWSWERRVHFNPVLEPSVVVFIIQSITKRNSIGDKMQPCRTPVFTEKGSVSSRLCITLYSDLGIVVGLLYDGNKLLRDSIVAENLPECVVVDTIEGLFEVDESDV